MSIVKGPTDVTVSPVAGRIGAIVSGIHLTPTLSESSFITIQQALLKHKVLFFRNQTHLTDQEQENFAQLFGTPEAHPTVPSKEGTNFLLELDSAHPGGRANAWHTDVTFNDKFPKICILRAVDVPAYGGDTAWANTAAAYENLPSHLQQLAEKLWAIHTNDYDYAKKQPNPTKEQLAQHKNVFAQTVYETEHPIVSIHPDSGEKTLLLGQFIKRIKGLSTDESSHIYNVLQARVTELENTVRWSWQPGDVAIWDNRATQHYAINDYGDARRIMRRISIIGDIPSSVDGKQSIKRII
ncbi:TauD/TfdA family dioxygenase [Bacillus sp. JCM 19041]|uniref:TauD/TfdA dioxygenase family protein n=1 Tax=Bacillus sp. JCM 19041 TaxID=1460637 RepID=UPI0006D0EBF7